MSDMRTFSDARERLEEIVVEVRSKDVSLEKSLDLYDEAIKIGNRCSDLLDKGDFSAEEAEAVRLGKEALERSAQELDDVMSEETADETAADEDTSVEAAADGDAADTAEDEDVDSKENDDVDSTDEPEDDAGEIVDESAEEGIEQ